MQTPEPEEKVLEEEPEQLEEEEEAKVEVDEGEEQKVVEAEAGVPDEGEHDETDAEIEAMKKRVSEMEEEAAKIEALQNTVEKSLKAPQGGAPAAHGPTVDARSIFVGNVDYSTTNDELKDFFKSCGTVNRVTINVDKWTGQPKGFAYVEFSDPEAIMNAMILNETPFKQRPLKITPKRTNVPGYRGRGRGRGGFRGRGRGYYGGHRGRGRGRGRGYHPYW